MSNKKKSECYLRCNDRCWNNSFMVVFNRSVQVQIGEYERLCIESFEEVDVIRSLASRKSNISDNSFPFPSPSLRGLNLTFLTDTNSKNREGSVPLSYPQGGLALASRSEKHETCQKILKHLNFIIENNKRSMRRGTPQL